MKKIILVSPNFHPPASRGQKLFSPSVAEKWSPFKFVMAPLGLATVAALTPNNVEVDIWDEAIHGPIGPDTQFKEDYALAGITGYINQAGRVKELGQIFRNRGLLTAVGGPGVSSEPELFRDSFDVLFIGEAEYTWPRFIADWQAGQYRAIYRQVGKVDLADTPPPRWDQVALRSYLMGTVQTTRGCPFDCEFCDVIYIFGRQARHKPIDRVLQEVIALEQHGGRRLLFCDDNFIGSPRYTKDLVRELIPLNRSFRRPVSFFAQLTLNVAKDDEMLKLMADANFLGVFIGIESPNRESLIETNKPQNYQTDMVAAIRKIQSYGIIIQSGMIVGFDHDDIAVFDEHFEFLQQTGLAVPMINLLKAPKGTRLWARLHKEGRVINLPDYTRTTNVESLTNVIPKQMTLVELLSGYLRLVERVRDWRNFEARAQVMISHVRRRPGIAARSSLKEILLFPRLLLRMNPEGRWTTLRLLVYALKRAPFMLESVMGTVAFQYLEAQRVSSLKESVGEKIRLLTESGMKLEPERTNFLIPGEFRKSYTAIFPELYRRIYRGLADKSQAQNAIVQVICDFLTRWGPTFEQFELHHRLFLEELCDRTIAAENHKSCSSINSHGNAVRMPTENGELDQQHALHLPHLADDVLRCVEQDLRMLQPA